MPPTGANTNEAFNKGIALCASCDRCRARKTKCDGQRPCGNCATKYMKKNKLTSIQGIDLSLFECVFSPAKRRGPVPGKAGQARKAEEMESGGAGNMSGVGQKGNSNLMRMDLGMGAFGAGNNMLLKQTQQQVSALEMAQVTGMGGNVNATNNQANNDPLAYQRQLLMQQQLAMQGLGGMDQTMANPASMNMGQQAMSNPMAFNMMQQQLQLQQQQEALNKMMQQMQGQQHNMNLDANATTNGVGVTANPAQRARMGKSGAPSGEFTSKTVAKHLPLLEKSSVEGNRLRSYYSLSVDMLFYLPPVPSDEEYCVKLNIPMDPSTVPQFDLAALRAARFSEIALGALVSNQIALSLELSNAAVSCLKECAEEPVHPSCIYEVARAYFLHGMFRSYRGDMARYFKYRRVCLAKLSQFPSDTAGVMTLLSAISFHDSFAYMVYNANEESLPNIDEIIPPVSSSMDQEFISASEIKYKTSTDPSQIACNPQNQMWIQGPPPVFINNEAPPLSRSLDALACAIRSCCDQANSRFLEMAQSQDKKSSSSSKSNDVNMFSMSATSAAVTANKNELCSRNMVLSAYTLLQQSEARSTFEKNNGHHVLISSMDAFLEGGDSEEAGGFSDSQIQSLLSVCNTVISKPIILYQAGPTYHMVTNTAVLLCHLLNGLQAKRERDNSAGQSFGDMESALFDEVLETFIAMRKLLTDHRRKLPALLRCHRLPRPNLMLNNEQPNVPVVDLGETLMCSSRGCQGFVLMACSPCVAAERAAAAVEIRNQEIAMNNRQSEHDEAKDGDDMDYDILELGDALDLEDDALIKILGKIVSG